MFTLITYDIESDKLRGKIAKCLEAWGSRVQYSVFECHLNSKEYKTVKKRLAALVKNEALKSSAGKEPAGITSIRLYQLCASCMDRVEIIGDGDITDDFAYYVV